MAFKWFSAFVLVCSILVISSEGQLHLLKYINSGNTNPLANIPVQFNSSMNISELRNVRKKFSNADSICVSGMWALYNNTDFGEGADDTTTVISIRGTNINTCTKPGQIPVLRSVQSVMYLGNSNYSNDGLYIFSQPYLLGGLWKVSVASNGTVDALPESISGFPLASLAITGSKAWLICGDKDIPCSNGVCVDMAYYENLFLQRNAAKDNSITNGWPGTVRKIEIVSSTVCSNYPRPIPPKSRRLFKRDAVEVVDISVDKLST